MGDMMLREPGRLFRDLWDDFMDWTDKTPATGGRRWAPAVDVKAEDDKYVLEADLPGLDKKDVDVRIEGDTLTISSSKEEEREEKEEGYLRKERYSRSFRRNFRLPSDVAKDKIDARFDQGVLTLTMPRTEEKTQHGRQIEVKG